jgi:hypothetical protein
VTRVETAATRPVLARFHVRVSEKTLAPCKRRECDQGYTRCGCPVWILRTLCGKRIPADASRYLPEPPVAMGARAGAAAVVGEDRRTRPEVYLASTPAAAELDSPTVDKAISAYLQAARDQSVSAATVDKKHLVFDKLLRAFCAEKGIRFVKELDLAAMQELRGRWSVGALTSRRLPVRDMARACQAARRAGNAKPRDISGPYGPCRPMRRGRRIVERHGRRNDGQRMPAPSARLRIEEAPARAVAPS